MSEGKKTFFVADERNKKKTIGQVEFASSMCLHGTNDRRDKLKKMPNICSNIRPQNISCLKSAVNEAVLQSHSWQLDQTNKSQAKFIQDFNSQPPILPEFSRLPSDCEQVQD